MKKAFGEAPKRSETYMLGNRAISSSDPEDVAKLEKNIDELVQEWGRGGAGGSPEASGSRTTPSRWRM